MTVIAGEHDDWVEGSGHADLLQGDNADQFQNDTLGGNDVVIGGLGNDDVEGEGGDDILVGEASGTDRNHGGLGWDWMTYYGQTVGVTSDWAFNRVFEPNNPLPSRFDLLEALSGGSGNDILRGPIVEPDDLAPSEIELNKATEAAFARIGGLTEMLRPVIQVGGSRSRWGTSRSRSCEVRRRQTSTACTRSIIGGPGSDIVEGRGGNDYLDGDAMLRVRLTDGTNFWDSARRLQSRGVRRHARPGRRSTSCATSSYDAEARGHRHRVLRQRVRGVHDHADRPARFGLLAGGAHAVAEAEESDGVDVIRGFERLQFRTAAPQLSADGTQLGVL